MISVDKVFTPIQLPVGDVMLPQFNRYNFEFSILACEYTGRNYMLLTLYISIPGDRKQSWKILKRRREIKNNFLSQNVCPEITFLSTIQRLHTVQQYSGNRALIPCDGFHFSHFSSSQALKRDIHGHTFYDENGVLKIPLPHFTMVKVIFCSHCMLVGN